MESSAVHAAGLVIRDLPLLHSSWRASHSLSQFLAEAGTVAIAGIDTRMLTRILRERGAQGGCIATADKADAEVALRAAKAFPGLKGMDLARVVTSRTPYQWNDGSISREASRVLRAGSRLHVVAYDYGIKRNILRLLADHGCRITVVPAQTPADKVLALNPEGIFLSNGPGDPEPCTYAIDAIRKLLETDIPIFGICLGHQLLGLASDAKTVKMKFGHHGANHPVLDIASGRVLISSQNHGFAVDETTLGANVKVTHKSLFDGSLQGIERTDRPAFSFQGHPEASPGPREVRSAFARFVAMIHDRLNAQSAARDAGKK